MSVETTWHIEGYVVLYIYEGEVTLEELQRANQWGIACTRTYPDRKIHHIADVTKQTSTPLSATALRDMMSIFKEPNFGWLVVVGLNNLPARLLTAATSHMFKVNVRTALTMTEAIQFLQEIDPTLIASNP